MTHGKTLVGYIRVSTEKQGKSGLGMEAQQESLRNLAASNASRILRTYVEVETGKGGGENRPELLKAIAHAKRTGSTLAIAKLDRLARNVHFVSGLTESDVDFVCCDMPFATKLTIHILAAVAEHEAEAISRRTKDALAAAKRRGVVLGGARPECRENLSQAARKRGAKAAGEAARRKADELAGGLRDTLAGMVAEGLSLAKMAERLNAEDGETAKGRKWGAVQVSRVLARLGIEKRDGRRKEARK